MHNNVIKMHFLWIPILLFTTRHTGGILRTYPSLIFSVIWCIQIFISDIRVNNMYQLQQSKVHPPTWVLWWASNNNSSDSSGLVTLVTVETEPEVIHDECRPLALSVWSLDHSWARPLLCGNEFQKAASIIHIYKRTAWPLFLEMRLN